MPSLAPIALHLLGHLSRIGPARSFAKAAREPRRAQEDKLREIAGRNAGTEYGRAQGLEGSLSPQQFDDKGAPLPRQPLIYFNDQIVTLDQLRAALDRLPASRIKPTLLVKPDKDVPVDFISSLLDAAGPRFDFEIATQAAGAGASP